MAVSELADTGNRQAVLIRQFAQIGPQRQLPFHAVHPVFDAPKLAAARIDQQVQPLRIPDLIRLALGPCTADRCIGERHMGASFQ